MEGALYARDHIGVEDFVLLKDYENQEAFVENLRKRFSADLIYTYIGPVLLSVNPYKELDIYTEKLVEEYEGVIYYEHPPHVFALTNAALTSMVEERRNQCILISGESGSGKTEASKKILRYIGVVCSHHHNVQSITDKLIQSNPVLEAFGNAKTIRNDNSSRFGKYMDIEFNYLGEPTGGHMKSYLLEKSRVTYQCQGERNFHIFYQILAGMPDDQMRQLCLERDPTLYSYTKLDQQNGIDDQDQYRTVCNAMNIIGFSNEEQYNIQAILAGILHMGNVRLESDGDLCRITNMDAVELVSKVMGIPSTSIQHALTHRTIEARDETVVTPLNEEQGNYARDALSKSVYDRLFSWLVSRLNTSLASENRNESKTLLGILDIYGFEIFNRNGFEQFCINYCNEKLQQLFIELTLKSEQEEYLSEGIEWEPVQYFNNKVICDLIESKHTGMISLMDEECLRPGEATDLTYLDKLNNRLGTHPHYLSHQIADNKAKKDIEREQFRLLHYAGDVTYNVEGFLEKNNDLLYRDLKEAISQSTNPVAQELFPKSEFLYKKMPETVASQFKKSLDKLMTILMSKEPSYIRCIKPNDNKSSDLFNNQIVSHQVKYLGLMENLRVRRAGFAYRRPFQPFLDRYKPLCPSTWPCYKGTPRDGVGELMRHLNYKNDDYKMGKTKLFIRLPQTIFDIEDAYQARKHELATLIKKIWKGQRQRKEYHKMREAAICMEKYVRRLLAKKEAEKRRWAVDAVRRFITGYITRNGPMTDINRKFVLIVKREWLKRLSKNLPKTVLDQKWPQAPPCCQEASELLRPMHRTWLARRYVNDIRKDHQRLYQMDLKVLAERLFKDKKDGYQQSIGRPFKENRLNSQDELQRSMFESTIKRAEERTKYSTSVVKYDRHGYKSRRRALFITNHTCYIVDSESKFKLKDIYSLNDMSVTMSSTKDGLLVLSKPILNNKDKGDLILVCPDVIELVTKLIEISKHSVKMQINSENTLTHKLRSGRMGTINLEEGNYNAVRKNKKDGNLVVEFSRRA